MNLVLGLFVGVGGALPRDPVTWILIGASADAGMLLRSTWWSLLCAAASFAVIYTFAAGQTGRGNLDIEGLAALGAAVLALIAYALGRLARLAFIPRH